MKSQIHNELKIKIDLERSVKKIGRTKEFTDRFYFVRIQDICGLICFAVKASGNYKRDMGAIFRKIKSELHL